jgi:uncharacterized protein with HEPN domain
MWHDCAWILDMLQASQKVLESTRDFSELEFCTRGLHHDAVLRQLTVVGEAAKRVSAAC